MKKGTKYKTGKKYKQMQKNLTTNQINYSSDLLTDTSTPTKTQSERLILYLCFTWCLYGVLYGLTYNFQYLDSQCLHIMYWKQHFSLCLGMEFHCSLGGGHSTQVFLLLLHTRGSALCKTLLN